MIKRFTIRPKPIKGEALSSYLIRIASRNYVKVRHLLKYINENGREAKFYYLDIIPEKICNLKKLGQLTGLKTDELRRLTFINAYEKFYFDLKELIDGKSKPVNTKFIVKNKRKFCAHCLKEYGIFKLIWQVNEIDVCDVHNVQLRSACRECGKEQPYFSDSHAELKCHFCKKTLIYNEDVYIKNENKANNTWSFLLDSDKRFYFNNEPTNYKIKLASAIFQKYQLIENTLSINEKKEIRSELDYTRLNMFVRGTRKKYFILSRISKILNILKMTIDEFAHIGENDNEFKNATTKVDLDTLGPCLSPWCKSYGSNKSMKEVEKYKFYGNFKHTSICWDCFMKFGYSKKHELWIPYDDSVDFIWSMVYPRLLNGLNRNQIATSLNCNLDRVSSAIGYCLSNELLPKHIHKIHMKFTVPKNILDLFKRLYIEKGGMRNKAIRDFGWESLQYYFYFHQKIIQNYLFSTPYQNKGKKSRDIPGDWKKKITEAIKYLYQNDIDITKENISKCLNCTNALVKRYILNELARDFKKKQNEERKEAYTLKIKEKFIEYICISLNNARKATMIGACSYANIPFSTFKQYYPDLSDWLIDEINTCNKEFEKNKTENYKMTINNAMIRLNTAGECVTYNNIQKVTKINRNVIDRKDIVEFIKEQKVILFG